MNASILCSVSITTTTSTTQNTIYPWPPLATRCSIPSFYGSIMPVTTSSMTPFDLSMYWRTFGCATSVCTSPTYSFQPSGTLKTTRAPRSKTSAPVAFSSVDKTCSFGTCTRGKENGRAKFCTYIPLACWVPLARYSTTMINIVQPTTTIVHACHLP